MKRIVSICLAMLCIIAFSLGFVGCDGEQVGSEPEGEEAVIALELEPEKVKEVLSDDLSSGMFSLNGVVYTLPVHFSELEANGWSFCDVKNDHHVATDILESEDFSIWTLTDGNQYAIVTFTNWLAEALPVNESYITGIAALEIFSDAQIILPGNIMRGSTYEDVIAAYWATESRSVFENSLTLHFSTGAGGISLSISIDNETNLVTFMDMHYWGRHD